jgi:type I restriction enzyme, S subunit
LAFQNCRLVSEEEHRRFREKAAPRVGDILFGKAASTGKIARVKTTEEFSIWSPLALLRPNQNKIDSAFFEYALKSSVAQAQVDTLLTANTQNNISMEAIPSIRIAVPSLAEQQRIAFYLGSETTRIDALVAAKERLLKRLMEKRNAVIVGVVTRGLNSDAPLRNSGISWLSKIPAHWEAHRAAWLFRDRDERSEPDLPLLEVSISAGVVLREFSDDRIEGTASDFNTYKVARKGDIVFNMMRMWQGAVGVAPEDGLVSPDYTVAAPTGTLLSEYAGLLFRTEMFSAECARNSHGIVWDRLRLYWEGFRDIVIPVPPLPEQRAIVGHIEKETARLDALKQATERTIALLKERRSALITEAVTGKTRIN